MRSVGRAVLRGWLVGLRQREAGAAPQQARQGLQAEQQEARAEARRRQG